MSEFDKKLCERIFFSVPGLTDSKIGEFIGLRRQSVQGWRKGKSWPRLKHIHTLAKITGISERWYITGKTSDINSITLAYYPRFYAKNTIIELPAYELARSIAAKAIINPLDRNFLPLLTILHRIAFKTGTNDTLYKTISKLSKRNFSDYDFSSLTEKSEHIKTFLARMISDYIDVSKDYNLPGIKDPATCIPYPTAVTKVNTYTCCNTSCVEDNKSRRIRIIGNDMSPVINNNQLVIIGSKQSVNNYYPHTPHPAIIDVRNMKENNPRGTNRSSIICRYVYNTGSQLLLTTANQQHQPYIINYADIIAIYPITSILWD